MRSSLPFYLLLLGIILLPSSWLQAQDLRVDSLVQSVAHITDDSLRIQRLIEAWQLVKNSDPAYAQRILQSAGQMADSVGSAWGKSLVLFNQGFHLTLEGKMEAARESYLNSMPYPQAVQDSQMLLNIYVNLVNLDYNLGKYDSVIVQADSFMTFSPSDEKGRKARAFLENLKGLSNWLLGNNLLAAESFTQNVEFYESIGDSSRLADSWGFLGLTQMDLKQLEQGRKSIHRAVALYQKLEDQFYLGQALNNLGMNFLEEELADSAEFYLRKSFVINQENDFSTLQLNLFNLGKLARMRGQRQKANQLFLDAIIRFEEAQDPRSQIDTRTVYADNLREQGQYQEAEKQLGMVNTILTQFPNRNGRINLWEGQAKLYQATGRWQLAAKFREKLMAAKDSVYEASSLRKQNEYLVAFETRKKEQALLIEQQKNTKLEQETRIKRLENRLLWLLIFALILLTGLGFVIYRQIVRRRQEEAAEERRSLERDLEFKQRELTTHTLHLVSKNKLLGQLKGAIESLKEESADKQPFISLIGSIDHDLRQDDDWAHFERYFQQVHPDFEAKLKRAFSDLTGNEIRLLTLMKMNLSTKEIASILNISPDSVKKARYRLRKKRNLPDEQKLQEFVLDL